MVKFNEHPSVKFSSLNFAFASNLTPFGRLNLKRSECEIFLESGGDGSDFGLAASCVGRNLPKKDYL
ncbi:hypothetical protein [Campylobacter showae]|uniref:hypothetical protein n=1 Tax=Campylobacter showae TaxID=204 RepID=UPI0026F01239|nr:hypothetical protein [Campylobacter showae]